MQQLRERQQSRIGPILVFSTKTTIKPPTYFTLVVGKRGVELLDTGSGVVEAEVVGVLVAHGPTLDEELVAGVQRTEAR